MSPNAGLSPVDRIPSSLVALFGSAWWWRVNTVVHARILVPTIVRFIWWINCDRKKVPSWMWLILHLKSIIWCTAVKSLHFYFFLFQLNNYPTGIFNIKYCKRHEPFYYLLGTCELNNPNLFIHVSTNYNKNILLGLKTVQIHLIKHYRLNYIHNTKMQSLVENRSSVPVGNGLQSRLRNRD
jgi:hypothetical protein